MHLVTQGSIKPEPDFCEDLGSPIGKPSFQCNVCDKTFPQSSDLEIHRNIHMTQKPHMCHFCDRTFPGNHGLMIHMRSHTGEKPYICVICNKSYSHTNHLRNHMRYHFFNNPSCRYSGNNKITVREIKQIRVMDVNRIKDLGSSTKSPIGAISLKCGETFPQLSNLEIHSAQKSFHDNPSDNCSQNGKATVREIKQIVVKDDNGIECELCHQSFANNKYLSLHMKSHTREKTFLCKSCNKYFASKSALRSHERTHIGDTSFECNVCDKTFSQVSDLEIHIKIHRAKKTFACDFCNRTFYGNHGLMIHLRSHTGEKPYSCEICNKSYSHTNHLSNHMRHHFLNNPSVFYSQNGKASVHEIKENGAMDVSGFECGQCNKSFANNRHLLAHVRSHTGEKPYSCKSCNKAFAYTSALTRHEKTHVGEETYKCEICAETFSRKRYYNQHLRMHSPERSKCETIGESYSWDVNQKIHETEHSDRKCFQCELCYKCFPCRRNLTMHMRCHTGEKPYQCKICGKAFSHSGDLTRHGKTHMGQKPYKCGVCSESFTRKRYYKQHVILKDHAEVIPVKIKNTGTFSIQKGAESVR